MRKPTLYLMCGLPGAGKTTRAKRLAQEAPALRLTPDDWMTPLFGQSICDPNTLPSWNDSHERVESVQWEIAQRALELGINVVLDFGVWSREERDDFRDRAAAVAPGPSWCLSKSRWICSNKGSGHETVSRDTRPTRSAKPI